MGVVGDVLPVAHLVEDDVVAWRSLAGEASTPSAFSEAEVVLAAARHLRGGADAHLLRVRDGSDLLFALPVVRGRVRGDVPWNAWSSWRHDHSFFGAPLLRAGAGGPAWRAVVDLLRAAGREAWLRLDRFPADGEVRTSLDEVLSRWDQRPVVVAQQERAALRTTDASSARRHRGLRRAGRRLEEHLGSPLALVDRTGEASALEDFLRLEGSGWKGAAGTALRSRAGDERFVRDLVRDWPDRVQLLFLEAQGRSLAGQLNLLAGDTCFAVKVGYDAELAAWSPGMVLELAVVERARRERAFSLLDSCAEPGASVERVFPHRRVLQTVLVPLSVPGAGAARLLRAARAGAQPRPASTWRSRTTVDLSRSRTTAT